MKSIYINDVNSKSLTYMKPIFEAIDNRQLEYNWLITNFDGYPRNPAYEKLLFSQTQDYSWITGEQLTAMVNDEDFPWVWGVLSGFDNNVILSNVLKYELPFADGNKNFWIDEVSIQHPLAEVEIVAFDGSFTLFLCKDDTLADLIMKAFPESYDLRLNNIKTNAQVSHIVDLIKSFYDTYMSDILLQDEYFKWKVWNALYMDKNTPSDEEIIKVINELKG